MVDKEVCIFNIGPDPLGILFWPYNGFVKDASNILNVWHG